jgi:hypothetical protein
VASSYPNFSTAFYTKTNVSAVVGSGKLTGIFEGKAPQGTNYPFGVWNFQGGEPVLYGFNTTQLAEGFYLQMRVYAKNQAQAHTLLATWISTLGNSLTVTGFTIGWLARHSDLPPIDQLVADEYIFGRGALIAVKAE